MRITLNTTPTCQTCKIAARRLEAAGVDVNLVDLTERPDLLAALKERLGVPQESPIQVPLFEDENDEIFDITGLPAILARAAV